MGELPSDRDPPGPETDRKGTLEAQPKEADIQPYNLPCVIRGARLSDAVDRGWTFVSTRSTPVKWLFSIRLRRVGGPGGPLAGSGGATSAGLDRPGDSGAVRSRARGSGQGPPARRNTLKSNSLTVVNLVLTKVHQRSTGGAGASAESGAGAKRASGARERADRSATRRPSGCRWSVGRVPDPMPAWDGPTKISG
jgi:hypothetical protein